MLKTRPFHVAAEHATLLANRFNHRPLAACLSHDPHDPLAVTHERADTGTHGCPASSAHLRHAAGSFDALPARRDDADFLPEPVCFGTPRPAGAPRRDAGALRSFCRSASSSSTYAALALRAASSLPSVTPS